MKVYIAGPMTGLPGLNHAAFDEAATMFRKHGNDVFSPAEYGRTVDTDFRSRHAFVVYAGYICNADKIYMLKGWEISVGARAEHALAAAVGCDIEYQ